MSSKRFERYVLLAQRFGARSMLFQHAAARQLDLSGTELECLRLIQHEGPLTASDLADETGFTRASLSVVVEKLSQRGLINREQDREDRRRWLLSTSKSVTDKIDENYAFHAARVEALLESYSEEEFQLVLQFMTSLSQELKIAAIEFRNSVKRD